MLIVMTVVLGVMYPLAITAFAQLAVGDRADGQYLEVDGAIVGSRLIGQEFASREYFHSRPSAVGYDGAMSGGSNLGPTSAVLLKTVAERVDEYRVLNGLAEDVAVPVDAVTDVRLGPRPSHLAGQRPIPGPTRRRRTITRYRDCPRTGRRSHRASRARHRW